MWSASSRTVICTSSSEMSFCFIRSSRRPGQATTMSTPPLSAETCRPWDTPPKMTVVFRPSTLASGAIVASIWVASSRVGASTRARGRRATLPLPAAAVRVTSGRANASVLPEPVRPRPRTSRPASESGSVAVWMGKGAVMPCSVSAEDRAAGTPSVAKEVKVEPLGQLFTSELVGVRRQSNLSGCSGDLHDAGRAGSRSPWCLQSLTRVSGQPVRGGERHKARSRGCLCRGVRRGRSGMTSTVIASARDLRKVYGSGPTAVRALDGVDVDLVRGELTAIMGPSGSGKSTLMHCLAGLDKPTSGTVVVDGETVSSMSERRLTTLRRTRVGFIFQAYNLVPTLTALENITLPLDIARKPVDRAHLDLVVATLGLGDRLEPQAERAVGRPAAARRVRAGAGEQTGRGVRRRADGQPRQHGGRRGARVPAPQRRRARSVGRDGHARPDVGRVRAPGPVPRRRTAGRRAARPHPGRGPGAARRASRAVRPSGPRRAARGAGAPRAVLPVRAGRRARRGVRRRHVRAAHDARLDVLGHRLDDDARATPTCAARTWWAGRASRTWSRASRATPSRSRWCRRSRASTASRRRSRTCPGRWCWSAPTGPRCRARRRRAWASPTTGAAARPSWSTAGHRPVAGRDRRRDVDPAGLRARGRRRDDRRDRRRGPAGHGRRRDRASGPRSPVPPSSSSTTRPVRRRSRPRAPSRRSPCWATTGSPSSSSSTGSRRSWRRPTRTPR